MSSSFIHPLTIGTVQLPNNMALAPMAGTSDLPFRRICHRMGAGLTITELVSARSVIHDRLLLRNWRYLAIDGAAGVMGIQLFGAEPDDFVLAINRILEHPVLSQCALIDINMGCPAKKVMKGQAGCALMRDPDRAAAIVRAAVYAAQKAKKPVTVKFRSGCDEQSICAPEFSRVLADAGAAALTIHARTAAQYYSGQADWSVIADVKKAVTVPVFGNGDVRTSEDVVRLFQETGVDGVMIGRAAQGNPWLFSEILQELGAEQQWMDQTVSKPTADERMAVIQEHFMGLIELVGEQTAVAEMRRHLSWYLKGQKGAAKLRVSIMSARTWDECQSVLEEWRMTSR